MRIHGARKTSVHPGGRRCFPTFSSDFLQEAVRISGVNTVLLGESVSGCVVECLSQRPGEHAQSSGPACLLDMSFRQMKGKRIIEDVAALPGSFLEPSLLCGPR